MVLMNGWEAFFRLVPVEGRPVGVQVEGGDRVECVGNAEEER